VPMKAAVLAHAQFSDLAPCSLLPGAELPYLQSRGAMPGVAFAPSGNREARARRSRISASSTRR